METNLSFRFVKTPGSMPLPPGVARQFKVFGTGQSLEEAPAMVFELDKPHMRGVTSIRIGPQTAWALECRSRSGTGSWELRTDADVSIGQIGGRGPLKQGWQLEVPGSNVQFSLANPDSVAKQAVRTMLGGDTEALVLLADGNPAGTLVRKHRDQAEGKKAGLLSGLKRFVTGRDWVLDIHEPDLRSKIAPPEQQVALAALGLVAVVSLELSTAD
ncbi:hypothetical protein [Roseibium sp.]|uniref:hypothetical protein n=1 Tax=Roseibium sp. TaxID=1936156 RepID=UPI003517D3FA